MGKIINFQYTNNLIYIILKLLIIIIQNTLNSQFPLFNSNFSLYLFYFFLAESFSIVLYFQEKKSSESNDELINQKAFINREIEEVQNENSKKKLYKFYIIGTIFFCGILHILFLIDYRDLITKILMDYQMIFYCIFVFINEPFFLNCKLYRHHYLGLILCSFYVIYKIIKDLSVIINENNFLYSILCLIIYSQLGFLFSARIIIQKILNFEYYVSIYYIYFLEGFFCLICVFIYILFSIFFYNDPSIKFFFTIIIYYNLFLYIIIIIIECLLDFLNLFCTLKIIQISRPSYDSIAFIVYSLILDLIVDTPENIFLILFNFIPIIGCLIYCEIIILNFYDLDKYTYIRTSKRGENELLLLNKSINSSVISNIDVTLEL